MKVDGVAPIRWNGLDCYGCSDGSLRPRYLSSMDFMPKRGGESWRVKEAFCYDPKVCREGIAMEQ